MLPFTGPRRGSRPFLPRHNRGGPARHLCALCAGSPPPSPPNPPPAPPFCPPSDNGSALCARLDKDFVSEKETVFVCQKRSAKKRDGEERPAASLAAPLSIGLAQPRARSRRPISVWGGVPTRLCVHTTHSVHLSHLAKPREHPPTQIINLRAAKRVCISPAPPGAPSAAPQVGLSPTSSGRSLLLRCSVPASRDGSPAPSSQPQSTGLTWLSLGHPQSGPFHPVFMLMSPRAAPRSEGSPGSIPWAAGGS